MNEFSILMHLLTKKNTIQNLGASKKEIIETLNYDNKNKGILFTETIINLANYIKPIGLHIRYNPIDSHWFISHETDISDLLKINPFEGRPKLAATLFCVIICCLKHSGSSKIAEIKKIRDKKDISDDLKELEQMGYLIINKEQSKIELTPLIGYQLNLEKLLIKVSLKSKDKIT